MRDRQGQTSFRVMRRRRADGRARRRGALPVAAAALAVVAALFLLGHKDSIAWEWGLQGAQEHAYTSPPSIDAPAPLSIAVTEEEPVQQTVSQVVSAPPRVFIYHTHASEAYLLTEDEPYEASGSWRTLDNTKNVVAIGALLQATLLSEHGIVALHDTANYEAPKLSSAYSRSLPAMENCREEHPTVELFIDIHRDAYGRNEENTAQDYIMLPGGEVARIMLVVGTGEGATGSGFGEMPDFDANLALAEQITNSLRRTDERLARDIRVKTGRYNQHVSNRCMLVEVGHTANTFTQAANSVPYLAAAVAEALKSVPEQGTLSTMRVWAP